MLKIFSLFILITSNITFASEQSEIENQMLGLVDINEQEILAPLSLEDKQYLEALKTKEAEMHELKGEVFPEIDFTQVEKLRKKRNKNIRQIIQSQSLRNYNFAEKEAMEVQLKDILKSGTFLGSIRRGSHLVHVKTGKTFYTQKDLIVRAYRLKDYEGYQLLQNKNGYITYKAYATNVVNIKEVTKMYDSPYRYKPVEKKINHNLKDSQLNYEINFMLNMGLTRPVFLRDLANKSFFGQTLRYEATTYGKWNFPIKMGITGQWERHFGSFKDGNYNMQSFSLGPSLKSKPYKIFGNLYTFIAQTRLALYSHISLKTLNQAANYETSQTNLVLGVTREIKTSLGRIILGTNFQRQWVIGSADQHELNVNAQNNFNDSFVLSIGHGTDWIW